MCIALRLSGSAYTCSLLTRQLVRNIHNMGRPFRQVHFALAFCSALQNPLYSRFHRTVTNGLQQCLLDAHSFSPAADGSPGSGRKRKAQETGNTLVLEFLSERQS